MIETVLNHNSTLSDSYDPSTIPVMEGKRRCTYSHKSKVLVGGSKRCTIGFMNKEKKPGKYPVNLMCDWFNDD